MRKQIFTLSLLLTLSLIPGLAAHAQSIQLSGNADCEGWSTNATLAFPSGVFSTTLDYYVLLSDQTGTEVASFGWTGQVQRWEDPIMNVLFGEPWDLNLDSFYTTRVVFHFLGEEAAMEFDVVCGDVDEPEPEPCHHTYRYWRQNPNEWPVDELLVGGEILSKDELLRLMRFQSPTHASFNLARHLVAARLNVLNGGDDSILPTIAAAEAFLVDHAGDPPRWWRRRSEVREFRKVLMLYNNQPCNSDQSEGGADEILLDKTFDDEPMTFDGLKAMYR